MIRLIPALTCASLFGLALGCSSGGSSGFADGGAGKPGSPVQPADAGSDVGLGGTGALGGSGGSSPGSGGSYGGSGGSYGGSGGSYGGSGGSYGGSGGSYGGSGGSGGSGSCPQFSDVCGACLSKSCCDKLAACEKETACWSCITTGAGCSPTTATVSVVQCAEDYCNAECYADAGAGCIPPGGFCTEHSQCCSGSCWIYVGECH